MSDFGALMVSMPSTRRITGLCSAALFETIPPDEIEKALRPFLGEDHEPPRPVSRPPLPVPDLPVADRPAAKSGPGSSRG